MHDTAFAIGSKFVDLYAPEQAFVVVEVGSQDVNGTLRTALPARAFYCGVDAEPAKNVDIVGFGSALPIADSAADITLASSVLEHDGTFWLTILELCRITKPGGFIYLSAPSNGAVHRYPADCWRFYPDAGPAMANWARRNRYEVTLVESFVADRQNDVWNDFVAILACGAPSPRKPEHFVHRHFPSTNIHQLGTDTLLNPSDATEDEKLFAASLGALMALERRFAAFDSSIESDGKPASLQAQIAWTMPSEVVRDIRDGAFLAAPLGLPFAKTVAGLDAALGRVESFKAAALRRERSLRARLLQAEQTVRDRIGVFGMTAEDIWFSIDRLTPSGVLGWAMHSLRIDERLEVRVFIQDQLLIETMADRPRSDLARLGYGDGRYGFQGTFASQIEVNPNNLRILARWKGADVQLIPRHSPLIDSGSPAWDERVMARSSFLSRCGRFAARLRRSVLGL